MIILGHPTQTDTFRYSNNEWIFFSIFLKVVAEIPTIFKNIAIKLFTIQKIFISVG